MRPFAAFLAPAFALTGLVAGAGLVTGCGHPATRQECDELFDRTAEIELSDQKIKDPALVQKRLAEARTERAEAFRKDCEGKRITRAALECVRHATTNQQFDQCLE